MHIMFGFLLFCLCVVVAIAMWRVLAVIIIGVVVLIIVIASVSNSGNHSTAAIQQTVAPVYQPPPLPPEPSTIKYAFVPGGTLYDITALYRGETLHCNGRIITYTLGILQGDNEIKTAILALGDADGIRPEWMHTLRGKINYSDIDLVGDISFNRSFLGDNASLTLRFEAACNVSLHSIPLSKLPKVADPPLPPKHLEQIAAPSETMASPAQAVRAELNEPRTPLARAAQTDAAYVQGRQARVDYEAWFGGLADNPYREGVIFWAANRSLKSPPACHTDSAEWQQGCEAARTRLSPIDRRRNTESDYRRGWNSL